MRRGLVVIDLQNEFAEIITTEMVLKLTELARIAESTRLPIYWIYSIYGEVSPTPEEQKLKISATHIGAKAMCVRGTSGSEFVPGIKTLAAKYGIKVEKHWYSAFKETELHALLQKDKITDLYICGVTLNSCVFATTCAAVELSYNVHLLSDCSNSFSTVRYSNGIDEFNRVTNTTDKVMTSTDLISQLTTFASGDTRMIYAFYPHNLDFEAFINEITWHDMIQQGKPAPRVISIQGLIDEHGNQPIYRKPMDFQPTLVPFTPTVESLRQYVQDRFNQPINHVVVQLYRSGEDHIGKHSDKTLDIAHDSIFFNFTFGATRTMVLSNKVNKIDKQDVYMMHNSMLCIGPQTNKEYHHGVARDVRNNSLKTEDELAYNQQRISITFRHIATYITKDGRLYGQGARNKSKTYEDFIASTANEEIMPPPVDDAQELIHAFSAENADPNFVWEQHYGQGFDAINLGKMN